MTGSQDYLTAPGSQDYLTTPPGSQEYLTTPPGSQEYLSTPPGTQDYLTTTVGTAPPQQHSPASTSSSGSAGYTNGATRPPVIPHMGWESPGGTTHFTTPPTFQYEPCYPLVITPMNGGGPPPQDVTGGVPAVPPPPIPPPQCLNGDSGRGGGGSTPQTGGAPPPQTQQPPPVPPHSAAPPTLHFHVKPGDPIQMPHNSQVPPIQGAMLHWVCNLHDHPIPLGPPGHYVINDNGMVLVSEPGGLYPPGPPPYTNGTTPPWSNQYYMSAPPPGSGNYMQQQPHQPHHQFYPVQDPNSNNTMSSMNTPGGRPSKPPFHKRKNRDPLKSGGGMNNGGLKSTGSTSPSLSVQSTPPQSPVKPRGGNGVNNINGGSNHYNHHYHHNHHHQNHHHHAAAQNSAAAGGYMYSRRGPNGNVGGPPPIMMVPGAVVGLGGSGGGAHLIGEDSEESGIGNEPDEDQVSDIMATRALLIWSPPVSDPGDSRFEVMKPILPEDLAYEVKLSDKGKDGKYRSIYNGDSVNCELQLTDLRPNTEYHVRVQANLKSRNLKGGTSDTVSFLTQCTVPDQPQPPKLTQRSRSALYLRWNAPSDNGKHILHYTLESDEGKGDNFKVVYEGRTRQCNVNRLQPSTIYRFRLMAVNELGNSPYSEMINYATQGSPPSQPQPPKLGEVTDSSIHLLWSKRPCDDEFTLQMEDPDTGFGFLAQYHGTDTEYTVKELGQNTSYRFKLRAHNEMGASAYSQHVSYSTKPGIPDPPNKPQVKGKVRATSCKVIWNPPEFDGGSPITSYELEMDGGAGWQNVYRGPATEFLFDELQPGTTYRVRVCSVSAGGIGEYSETCFVNTDPVVPGPPSPPQLVEKPKNKLVGTALALVWDPPAYDGGAIITEYEIDMTAPDNMTRTVYKGRETECVVASLLPGRPYLFQVRAYNRAGKGVWSQPLETISGAGPPDKPREPKAVVKSGTLVSISWDQPINNGAIITGYLLQMACVCEGLAASTTLSAADEDSDSDFTDEEEENEDEVIEDVYDDESSYSDQFQDETEDESEAAPVTTTKPTKKNKTINSGKTNKDGSKKMKVSSCAATELCDNDSAQPRAESPVVAEEDLSWKMVYSGEERMVDVRDMVPASQYQFKVCAMNSAGSSPYSCAISVSTPATTPSAPHTLITNTHINTSTCIAFKWKKPSANGEPITGYRIEWTERESTKNSTPSPTPSELFVTRRCARLENLKPDTTYNIRVQAVNAKGRGSFSAVLKAATKPLPPAPPRLDCVSASHNTLKLKWGEGSGKNLLSGTSYVLETENLGNTWHSVYSGIAVSFKHTKLAENQEYRYRISATSEAGQGPRSAPVTFRTSYAPPPALKLAPKVSALTESGCLIQWSALKSSQNQDQLHYKVLISRGKDCNPTSDSTSEYQVAADTQLRLSTLNPRTEYTVRVCTVRKLPAGVKPLDGHASPQSTFVTLAGESESKHNSSGKNHKESNMEEHRLGGSASSRGSSNSTDWSDKKYAAVILSGFTLFAIFVAMIIQQLISYGAISS